MIRATLRLLILGTMLGTVLWTIAGCEAQSADEAKVAAELAPKPMTDEQRRSLEDVKAKFPNAAPSHAGASR